jgi:hypothetical protein
MARFSLVSLRSYSAVQEQMQIKNRNLSVLSHTIKTKQIPTPFRDAIGTFHPSDRNQEAAIQNKTNNKNRTQSKNAT